MPTPEEYVAFLRHDGAALAAAAQGHLEDDVPSCPGWTVADLVRHTGEVHRKKLATVELGGTARPEHLDWEPSPDDESLLLDWYVEGLELLAERLGSTDPEQAAWSWAGDHRVAFWQRRMAQETLVHRWDAEDAAGTAGPMAAELAADGVDEYLRIFLDDPDTPPQGATGIITITLTDVAAQWTLDTTSWPPVVTDGAVENPDARMSGSAEAMLLALWRRRSLDTVDLQGDAEIIRAVHDAADL